MRLHSEVKKEVLEEHLKPFLGEITQLPPIRSRVKRAERQRTVHTFKILEIDGKDVLFETEVQAGTYIRKLIHDLGESLPNGKGAHMLELRRIKAGVFNEENIYTLYDFESAVDEYNSGNEDKLRDMIIPAEEAIKLVLPFMDVDKQLETKLLVGKPLMGSDLTDKEKLPNEEIFAIFNKERFIGIFKHFNDLKSPEIIAKAMFVFN